MAALEYLENYSPGDEVLSLEYDFAEPKIKFTDLEFLKPRFAFDYLSLKETTLCFNNPDLKVKDFIKLFEVKCDMSWITY